MLKEFKEFALKGNMVDMAVGIIIGAAFGVVVEDLPQPVAPAQIGQARDRTAVLRPFLLRDPARKAKDLRHSGRRSHRAASPQVQPGGSSGRRPDDRAAAAPAPCREPPPVTPLSPAPREATTTLRAAPAVVKTGGGT